MWPNVTGFILHPYEMNITKWNKDEWSGNAKAKMTTIKHTLFLPFSKFIFMFIFFLSPSYHYQTSHCFVLLFPYLYLSVNSCSAFLAFSDSIILTLFLSLSHSSISFKYFSLSLSNNLYALSLFSIFLSSSLLSNPLFSISIAIFHLFFPFSSIMSTFPSF